MAILYDGVYFVMFVIIVIYLYFYYIYSHWKRRGIPYITPTIPVGNLGDVFTGKENSATIIHNIYKELRSRGARFGGFWAVHYPNLMIIDPELIKTVMIKDFFSFSERGMHYDEESDPLSAHLIAIKNPKWNFLRKKFSPTFTPSKMKMMYPLISACGQNLLSVFSKAVRNDAPVDIYEVCARYSTDVIASTVFGLNANSLVDQESEFRKTGQKFFDGSLMHSIIFTTSLCAPSINKFFNLTLIHKSITKFFMGVIRDAVDYREKNKVEKKDMLQLLIKVKNNESIDDENEPAKEQSDLDITFENLAAQAFIFFIGGFENSSSAMTFALYELAQHQDVQDRLRKDILHAVQNNKGELTYEIVMDLPYLTMVLYETLRKYPTVPFMNRECTADFKLPGTDVTVEKGTMLIIPTIGVQHDPEHYENPDVFDPERFNEKDKKVKPNTFMPWGLGPRTCIGMRFGTLQVKIGLAMLIKDFKFTIDSSVELPLEMSPKTFVLAFQKTLWMRATRVTTGV